MALEKNVLSITELTRQIKFSMESSFPRVWVEGEISNFKQHTSGHLYFTLKDEGAQLSALMWRSRVANLTFQPEDGMKVIARGSITVYPPRGNYQLDADQLQPIGLGELQLAFERLKQKLEKEGLFDAGHKQPIPEFPECIGLVTSETGAALQDIRSVISRRQPSVRVILAPVRVQGTGAAEEIVEAIQTLNRLSGIDVMIVGRGGGSLEDLWPFNEEGVARAIYASKIPVISAVGHEIDFSIADFAADLRAPTPSAAAELVVRDRMELLEDIRNLCYTMRGAVNRQASDLRERTASLVSSYSFNRPKDMVREFSQRIDELERSLGYSFTHRAQKEHQKINFLQQQLQALNPGRVLKRGYAMVRKDGRIVSSAHGLILGDAADIQFHDGTVEVKVEKGHSS
ncbi:MAG: exodeoxyribonuclease VII large subunit [Ignavibacteriae bacterium]|nr:MAG: exodeoxyribonuclease VII large subunit [Ignavibacteriota bacterium]